MRSHLTPGSLLYAHGWSVAHARAPCLCAWVEICQDYPEDRIAREGIEAFTYEVNEEADAVDTDDDALVQAYAEEDLVIV